MKSILIVLLLSTALACGGAGTVTTNSSTSTLIAPQDLVLASPLQAAATTSLGASLGKATGDATGNDFAAKREALQTLIAGTGDCSFTLDFPDVASVQCYGPAVDYENHPDGPDAANPQLPSGDVGIWDAEESGSACAAAQVNTLINGVAAQVDNAISFFGAVACAQNKAEAASASVFGLPTAGETVNLATVLETYLEVDGLTVDSAVIDRAADDSEDGFPIYTTLVTVTLTQGEETQSGTWRLKHIPTADDGSTYRGRLSFSLSGGTEQGGNCQGLGVNEVVDGTSILYEKTSDTALVYEMNHAQYCGAETNPFDSDRELRADKATAGDTDGWANNWNYGLFSINPETVTGSVAYAWQAGMNDQRSRVLNVTTTSTNASTGAASGDAYYGFGPDINATTGVGTITGMICNWAGPGADGNKSTAGEELAQYQSIARASTGEVFTAESSQITYAPTNSCDTVAGNGFTYESVDATESVTFDNDRSDDTNAVTNNLVDLGDVDFTMPTAPTDV